MARSPDAAPAEKASRQRQRLRLIEACITALHEHGPSRTTIDKVVRIAEMSPGIVNFYFETKAALLVAALDHLAAEFEQFVQMPVAAMRARPAEALERVIDLYLDPTIASPRKVSVWYSFWGEASARSEYQAICGRRDLEFAELMRDLVAARIEERGDFHLDADAVALGLIGSLEMLWQEIAFRSEEEIDRNAMRARCRAYLASVFPAARGRAAAAPPLGPDQTGRALVLAGRVTLAGLEAHPVLLAACGLGVIARHTGGTWQTIAVWADVHAAIGGCPGCDWIALPDGEADAIIPIREWARLAPRLAAASRGARRAMLAPWRANYGLAAAAG